MNVTVLEDQIKHYYGSASATFPVVGTVTVPSPASNYAGQMHQIVSSAEAYLSRAIHTHHGSGKPAVVFDIDDTLLNTYDYEIANQFGFTPASNAVFVNAGAFPAVFFMPELVSFAASYGYAVFFITGRPQTQTDATVANLVSAGYAKPQDGHLFLKPATPPSYLHCANAPTCTTIEYKSGTRAHIASEGYTIMADFGDQYSDLLGGNAGHQVKIPNPDVLHPLTESRPVRPARGNGRAALRGQRGVAAAVEDERVARGSAGAGVPDPADHDLVVAAGQAVLDGALQDGEDTFDAGAACRPVPVVTDVIPGRGQPAPGEAGRQVLLLRGEHVDRERAVLPDRRQGQAGQVEADQDERRVERQRGDRVGGGAHRRTVGVDRGDHRDAGREVAHGRAELGGRDVLFCSRKPADWHHAHSCPWFGGRVSLSR